MSTIEEVVQEKPRNKQRRNRRKKEEKVDVAPTQHPRKPKGRAIPSKFRLSSTQKRQFSLVMEVQPDWSDVEVLAFCKKCNFTPSVISDALANAFEDSKITKNVNESQWNVIEKKPRGKTNNESAEATDFTKTKVEEPLRQAHKSKARADKKTRDFKHEGKRERKRDVKRENGTAKPHLKHRRDKQVMNKALSEPTAPAKPTYASMIKASSQPKRLPPKAAATPEKVEEMLEPTPSITQDDVILAKASATSFSEPIVEQEPAQTQSSMSLTTPDMLSASVEEDVPKAAEDTTQFQSSFMQFGKLSLTTESEEVIATTSQEPAPVERASTSQEMEHPPNTYAHHGAMPYMAHPDAMRYGEGYEYPPHMYHGYPHVPGVMPSFMLHPVTGVPVPVMHYEADECEQRQPQEHYQHYDARQHRGHHREQKPSDNRHHRVSSKRASGSMAEQQQAHQMPYNPSVGYPNAMYHYGYPPMPYPPQYPYQYHGYGGNPMMGYEQQHWQGRASDGQPQASHPPHVHLGPQTRTDTENSSDTWSSAAQFGSLASNQKEPAPAQQNYFQQQWRGVQ